MPEFYESFRLRETKYGIEVTVKDTERADEFDDFIVEVCSVEADYLLPVPDGMRFIFKSMSLEDANVLVERFNKTS